MKLYVFAIRDIKVGAFMVPYFLQSEGQARRSFQDEVNRASEDNLLYKHASDFSLFKLGVFDSETARFELAALPELVVEAAALRIDDSAQARVRGVN